MSALRRPWPLIGCVLAALAACSSGSNLPPPAPLPPSPHQVKIVRDWAHDVGGGGGDQLLGLAPDANHDVVVAASAGGDVVAVDVGNGAVKWRRHVRHARLSGGPAIGAGVVAVGSRSGEVIALNAATGKPEWRHYVGAPVDVAPAIGDGLVVAKTIAGDVTALSLKTGNEVWTQSESVPSLSLRFDTRPLIVQGAVYAGFADGKAMAVDAATGKQRWRKQVATGQGGNLVADIVDVGGLMAYAAGDLYVATYQGRLAALDAGSGQVIWSREVSSYTGVTLDAAHLYVSDAEGGVHAFDLVTGVPTWVYDKLGYRSLSAAVPFGATVAVGDDSGYVHFLSRDKGRYMGRVKVGDGPVRMAPVVVGNRLIVLDGDGTLAAYQLAGTGKRS